MEDDNLEKMLKWKNGVGSLPGKLFCIVVCIARHFCFFRAFIIEISLVI